LFVLELNPSTPVKADNRFHERVGCVVAARAIVRLVREIANFNGWEAGRGIGRHSLWRLEYIRSNARWGESILVDSIIGHVVNEDGVCTQT
jgi:hypothetical protein